MTSYVPAYSFERPSLGWPSYNYYSGAVVRLVIKLVHNGIDLIITRHRLRTFVRILHQQLLSGAPVLGLSLADRSLFDRSVPPEAPAGRSHFVGRWDMWAGPMIAP